MRKVDNAIHRINHYPIPADSVVHFVNTYPLGLRFYPVNCAIHPSNNWRLGYKNLSQVLRLYDFSSATALQLFASEMSSYKRGVHGRELFVLGLLREP